MSKTYAPFVSHTDANQNPSITGVVGTLGTSDTGGTAKPLPIGVKANTGAMYVHISGTDVDIGGGAGGGSMVNVVTGTQQTLGTVGTILGIGGTVAVSGASAGTVVQVEVGTINLVSSVSSVANLVKGTVTRLEGGTLTALAVGTVGGKAAVGAPAVANPVFIAGTNSGGTIEGVLTTEGKVVVDITNSIGVDAGAGWGIYDEDIAHTDADKGQAVLSVRVDGGTSLVGADLDYAPLQVNAAGALRVAGTAVVGTIPGIGVVSSVTAIAAGTQNTLGTVGAVNNIVTGTLAAVTSVGEVVKGTTTLVSTVTTVSNLTNGSARITLGSVGGLAAGGAAASGNPVLVGGTDAGGTVYAPLVTSAGALTVTGASAGTVVQVEVGTINLVSSVTSVANLIKGTITRLEGGTLTALAVGTVGGKAASGAAAVANPVQIAGTDAGGTIYSPLVTSAGALTVTGASAGTIVQVEVGTINLVGTVPGIGVVTSVSELVKGTVTSVTSVGTVVGVGVLTSVTNLVSGTLLNSGTTTGVGTITNLGTLTNIGALGLGTVYKGVPAPAAGSLTAAGTLTVAGSQNDTIYWDIGGTWVGTAFFEGQVGTSAFFGVPVITPQGVIGSQTTGNGDFMMNATGLDSARLRVTYSSGTLTHNERAANIHSPLTYVLGGSQSNVGMLNAGTIDNLVKGTVTRLEGGTLTNLVSGTINALAAGTVTAGTLTNLVSGTINALAAGTITGGTLQNLNNGTLALVTTVSNLTNGSVNLLTGTVTSVSNLAAGTITALALGTIKQNYTPVGSSVISTHTLGTGGTIFGTLLAPVGAGTILYLTGLQIIGHSGTCDYAITNNVAGSTGAGVYARGIFGPSGGVARDFEPAINMATNGTLCYLVNGNGTASFIVSYWVSP